MGSALGALKIAAARTGLSLEEYQARIANGEKWCTGCKGWHKVSEFGIDRSRYDGLTAQCTAYKKAHHKANYVPRPRPKAGRRFAKARDGDQKQARGRVNHLVNVGLLPDPNEVPCIDCGHIWTEGERRHEYDHHRGYTPEHHESVEAVCTTCHHTRENERRAA